MIRNVEEMDILNPLVVIRKKSYKSIWKPKKCDWYHRKNTCPTYR